jgi:hypothetical protein
MADVAASILELGLEEVETDVVSVDRVPETKGSWAINGMVGVSRNLRIAAK